MSDEQDAKSAPGATEFSRNVGVKAARKLKAQRHVSQSIWTGLGMMGMVGWSVAVPTVVGAAFGLWLDQRYPGGHSWTLMLLAVGLGLGCLTAWHWVARESREIREQEKNGDE